MLKANESKEYVLNILSAILFPIPDILLSKIKTFFKSLLSNPFKIYSSSFIVKTVYKNTVTKIIQIVVIIIALFPLKIIYELLSMYGE